ncbi:MAG: outer membrane beta-barrel protein [Woeseiaceae bacterium]|nr:outer membrane beta-barrel protein [Woeseiaceae bacterium]
MGRQPLVTAVLLCVASASLAQQKEASFELTPLVGYRFGGTFEIEESPDSYGIEDSASYGFILNFPHRANTRWEILYSRQSTDAEFSDRTSSNRFLDIESQMLQIGGTYQFDSENDAVQPYLAATIGGTHVKASANGSESDTFFSGSIGLGMLFAPNSRVGLRLEGRGHATFTNSSSNLLCVVSPDLNACTIEVTGDVVIQFEVFAGVVVRF